MSVLVLRLAGPIQSWGDGSRFLTRQTRKEPTKSGVVGLMASALGRARDESVEDLASLEFAVRVDKPGELVRDFHAARVRGQKNSMISNRYYLSDAVFVVALGGNDALLADVESALACPKWPLFLGRRSCPPDSPLVLGLHSEGDDVRDVLRGVPWQAPEWYRQRHCPAELQLVCDGREGEVCEARVDYPISFDFTKNRSYGMRSVFTDMIANPDFVAEPYSNVDEHDPMDF